MIAVTVVVSVVLLLAGCKIVEQEYKSSVKGSEKSMKAMYKNINESKNENIY